jgi:hypothetical protein
MQSLAHVPAKWSRFADKHMRQLWYLRRFPFKWDHSVITNERETPWAIVECLKHDRDRRQIPVPVSTAASMRRRCGVCLMRGPAMILAGGWTRG